MEVTKRRPVACPQLRDAAGALIGDPDVGAIKSHATGRRPRCKFSEKGPVACPQFCNSVGCRIRHPYIAAVENHLPRSLACCEGGGLIGAVPAKDGYLVWILSGSRCCRPGCGATEDSLTEAQAGNGEKQEGGTKSIANLDITAHVRLLKDFKSVKAFYE